MKTYKFNLNEAYFDQEGEYELALVELDPPVFYKHHKARVGYLLTLNGNPLFYGTDLRPGPALETEGKQAASDLLHFYDYNLHSNGNDEDREWLWEWTSKLERVTVHAIRIDVALQLKKGGEYNFRTALENMIDNMQLTEDNVVMAQWAPVDTGESLAREFQLDSDWADDIEWRELLD